MVKLVNVIRCQQKRQVPQPTFNSEQTVYTYGLLHKAIYYLSFHAILQDAKKLIPKPHISLRDFTHKEITKACE